MKIPVFMRLRYIVNKARLAREKAEQEAKEKGEDPSADVIQNGMAKVIERMIEEEGGV